MGLSMAWVGESVTGSFSRPYHHRGRIPPWAEWNLSMPYIEKAKLLETCEDFYYKNYVEGFRRC